MNAIELRLFLKQALAVADRSVISSVQEIILQNIPYLVVTMTSGSIFHIRVDRMV